MKTNFKLTLAVLGGLAIGISGAAAIHAQQVKTPPAYVIAEVDVHDATMFQKYATQVPGTMVPYQGHYLVRGGKIQAVEGDAPKRFVVVAFDSMAKAAAWEDSPGYDAIKGIRHSSATSTVFIAEGVAPQ